MERTIEFLASRNGRITRVVVGIILLVIGLAVGLNVRSAFGWILTVISLFPLVGGVFDICFIAPFFGKSLSGARIRTGEQVEDPLEELKVLQPEIDKKNQALLALMRYWLFGTFMIVSAAAYSYAWMMTYDGDFGQALAATFPIWGAVAALCAITYFGYWIFVTRIRVPRQVAQEKDRQASPDQGNE